MMGGGGGAAVVERRKLAQALINTIVFAIRHKELVINGTPALQQQQQHVHHSVFIIRSSAARERARLFTR